MFWPLFLSPGNGLCGRLSPKADMTEDFILLEKVGDSGVLSTGWRGRRARWGAPWDDWSVSHWRLS